MFRLAAGTSPANRCRRWCRLLACAAILAGVWLVLLPWVALRASMEAHLQWLDERGIDPSAMYYTELEAMTPILEKLEQR